MLPVHCCKFINDNLAVMFNVRSGGLERARACKDSKSPPPVFLPHTGLVCPATAMGPRALHALHTLLLRH